MQVVIALSNQLNALKIRMIPPPPPSPKCSSNEKKKHIVGFTILFSGCCIDMARPFARSLNITVKIHLHETGTSQNGQREIVSADFQSFSTPLFKAE